MNRIHTAIVAAIAALTVMPLSTACSSSPSLTDTQKKAVDSVTKETSISKDDATCMARKLDKDGVDKMIEDPQLNETDSYPEGGEIRHAYEQCSGKSFNF